MYAASQHIRAALAPAADLRPRLAITIKCRMNAATAIRSILALLALSMLALAGVAAAKPWWMRGVESNEPISCRRTSPFGSARRSTATAAGALGHRRRLLLVPQQDRDRGGKPRPAWSGRPSCREASVQDRSVPRHAGDLSAAGRGHACPIRACDSGAHPLQIKVTYQGCAEAGLCYPPITKVLFPDGGSAALLPHSRAPRPVGEHGDPRRRPRISARRAGAAQRPPPRRRVMNRARAALGGRALPSRLVRGPARRISAARDGRRSRMRAGEASAPPAGEPAPGRCPRCHDAAPVDAWPRRRRSLSAAGVHAERPRRHAHIDRRLAAASR